MSTATKSQYPCKQCHTPVWKAQYELKTWSGNCKSCKGKTNGKYTARDEQKG